MDDWWKVLCIWILFTPPIMTMKGETEHAYLFGGHYSWIEATRACTLIGSQPLVNISTSRNQLGWINETVFYSPWLEYLGCFGINEDQILNVPIVHAGTQMQECLLLCKDNFFIGLQQSRCACLKNTSLHFGNVYVQCGSMSSVHCQQDQNAICAVDNNANKFALYKKESNKHGIIFGSVVIDGNIGIGDCLTVTSNSQGSIFYWASRCDLQLFQICSTDRIRSPANVTISENQKADRATSVTKCNYKFLASYSSATQGNLQLSLEEYYWLDNTRRHFFQSVNEQQPEYCVAAKTDRNGRMIKEIRDCKTKLPALCSGSEVADVNAKQSSIHDNLVIALIITATATCLIVVVVVLLFCRFKRSSLRHTLQPLAEIEKEVVYAQVDKSTKSTTKKDGDRDKTLANDCDCDDYDHTNHFSSPDVPLLTDNTYDTMQSIERGEENNYNCAHEAEKIFL